MRKVRVDAIVVLRGDAGAVKPMEDTGEEFAPILIRADKVLIDGLRRLKWFKEAGVAQIPAITVSDFLSAMQALKEQPMDRPLTPRRMWELSEVLRPYAMAWSRSKANGGWMKDENGVVMRDKNGVALRLPRRPKHRAEADKRSIRYHFRDALGVSEHEFQATNFIYRKAAQGDERARKLVARIDEGELSTQRAELLYKSPGGLTGTVTNGAEQERIMTKAVDGLHAQMTVIQKLGHPLAVDPHTLDTFINELLTIRGQLSAMLNGLRQIQKENDDQ